MSDEYDTPDGLPPLTPVPDLKGMSDEVAVTAMVTWFFSNYEDPAESTPWDEGEYVYLCGGPYNADVEIYEAFHNQATTDLIESAAKQINEDGYEWARVR